MEELQSFEEIFSRVSLALEQAVKDHGPDAVDLGLTLYTILGWQSVLLCILGLSILFVFFRYGWRSVKKLEEEARDLDKGGPTLVGVFVSLFFLIVWFKIFLKHFSIFYWASAFGYPEVLIGYQALHSVGLM